VTLSRILVSAATLAALLLPACRVEEEHETRAPKGAAKVAKPMDKQAAKPDKPAKPAKAAKAAKAAAHDAAPAFPYPVEKHRLANGLEVRFIPMPSNGLSAYWTIVRTGSRDEVEPGVTGFAHFFEHMMFRGTETLPGPEYDRIVNGMGADANAFTTDDFTAYHLGFASADLPTVIRIEADRFQNLKYDEGQFKTESGAVYGEYRKGRTSPFEVLFESLQDAAFDKHTYKHTTIGFEADIKDMPNQFAYSRGFFERFYRPENVVLVVAGDFDREAALAHISDHYAGWKRGYQAPAVPGEPAQAAQRRIDAPFDGQTLPILCVAFKGPALDAGDRLMVAGSLAGDLAFGETSALYKKLVLDEQRVEELFPFFGNSRDPGLWAVIAMVKDPADVHAVEGEIWSALEALRRDGPTAAQLDANRSRSKYAFLSSLTTPSAVCRNLAQTVAITGDVDAVEHWQATLDAVTVDDVRAAAARWLVPAVSTVAVLHARDEPVPAPRSSQPPLLMPVADDPNVSFKLWFRAGSQDDPPGRRGLASLVGDLVSEGGTRARSYDEMLAALYPLAAGYSVSVDKEMTVVSGTVHRDNLGAFYPLFLEALLSPGFREDDFARLKDSALNALDKELRYSSDEELGKAALYEAAYRGTPYEHLDLGAVESLRAITLQDVRDFWAARWTRDNVVIALGGAYPADLPDRLLADLARLRAATPPASPAPQPPPVAGRHVTLVAKPGPSTAISFGAPVGVRRGSREFCALWIANSWLGEHRNSSSHLYQVIREARGMNYGDYSYIEAYPNGGRRSMPPSGVGRRSHLFEVWIRPVPEQQALDALRAALREVETLVQDGLSAEQVEFTKKFLGNYSLHFAETTAERLGWALDDRYYGIPEPGHLAAFRKLMDEITPEEVNAAIRKHLQADNLHIAIVTEHAQELADALASGAPSPIDYGDVQKPAGILAEDQLIQAWPLKVAREDIRIVPVEEMFAR
jgi:zinc protease